MTILWPALIVGVILVIAGAISFIFRNRLQQLNSGIQKASLGQLGEVIRKNTSAGSMGAVGVFAIVFGCVLIAIALVYNPSPSAGI